MKKQYWLTITLFVVALASGFFIGRSVGHPPRLPHEGSWLADELKLDGAQKDAMRKIWSELVHGSGPRHFEQRRDALRHRDEAISKLITPEQRPAFDAISEQFNKQMLGMDKDRDVAMKQVIEKTRSILNPEQRAKYDKMVADGAMNPPWQRPGGTSRPAGKPSHDDRDR